VSALGIYIGLLLRLCAGVPVEASMLRIEAHLSGDRLAMGSASWTDRGVLTAWHVVDGAEAVWIIEPSGRRHAAWCWWRHGEQDAATVRLDAPLRLPMLRVAGGLAGPCRAQCIAYWGASRVLARPIIVYGDLRGPEGAVAGQGEIGAEFYAYTAPLIAGMSGGPLLVGRVVYGVASHIDGGRLSYIGRADLASRPAPSAILRPAARSAPHKADP
jgi:hypothetical protein